MPKLVSAVPKYRKKTRPGSAPQAVSTINGRDHYLGLYGSKASRLEYDRLINQWLASGRNPRFGLPDEQLEEPTLKELMNAYRKWCEKHYRDKDGTPTTTVASMKPLMRRLREWYGKTPVSKFTPLALKDVVQRSIDEGLSVSTINSWISRIKHMFRWGVAEELVRPPRPRCDLHEQTGGPNHAIARRHPSDGGSGMTIATIYWDVTNTASYPLKQARVRCSGAWRLSRQRPRPRIVIEILGKAQIRIYPIARSRALTGYL